MTVVMLSLAGAFLAAGPVLVPDTAGAARALAEFGTACEAEAGALWGAPVCGRLVLVHPGTRQAVSNAPAPEGAFQWQGEAGSESWAGRLPDDLPVANTALDWGGETWAMVLLPLPADPFARLTLLAHESFHRLQSELGIGGRDLLNPHLDERDGRLWLRLELRALAAALRAREDEEARRHAGAALAFRAERHRLYPGADTLEAALEHHEGLAEYTGMRVALMAGAGDLERVARATERFQERRSFVRALGYGTGPALGLLLDRFGPGWRDGAAAGAPLAPALARAVGGGDATADGAVGPAELAGRYGYDQVAGEEDTRAAERASRAADFRRLLVDGPLVVFRQDGLMRAFDPNALFPLDGGTVYPTGTFQAGWGRLVVTAGGALVSADFGQVVVPAPPGLAVPHAAGSEAVHIEGPGWTLELAPGWTFHQAGDHWEVVRRAGT